MRGNRSPTSLRSRGSVAPHSLCGELLLVCPIKYDGKNNDLWVAPHPGPDHYTAKMAVPQPSKINGTEHYCYLPENMQQYIMDSIQKRQRITDSG